LESLLEIIKKDYLTAYKWIFQKQGKPGIKLWKPKDNKAVSQLIKYMQAYYGAKRLTTAEMGTACRLWLNKASTTAPEWLRKDFELAVLVSRFEIIMESPDPKSESYRIAQLQKDKSKALKYNPKKHELERPMSQGEGAMLAEIIKTMRKAE